MYLVQKIYKINTNLFILICCMNDDGIQYMTGASWHWLIGQVIGVCSRGMVDQWGWQLAAGAEQPPHDEYEEDEHNLQIFVNVILVILLYCIISYPLSCIDFLFSFRRCEGCFQNRPGTVSFTGSVVGPISGCPDSDDAWTTYQAIEAGNYECYESETPWWQLSKTPWVAWLMMCSFVKKKQCPAWSW